MENGLKEVDPDQYTLTINFAFCPQLFDAFWAWYPLPSMP